MAYKMKGHELPGPNQRKESPAKKGFLKKAGDAYMGSLKTSAEGFARGGLLGALGAQFAAGMNKKKKKKETPKKKDSNQVIDQGAMKDVADNLKETEENN